MIEIELFKCVTARRAKTGKIVLNHFHLFLIFAITMRRGRDDLWLKSFIPLISPASNTTR